MVTVTATVFDQAELIPTTREDVERLAQRVATTRGNLEYATRDLKQARAEHKQAVEAHDKAVAQFCEARARLARQNGELVLPDDLPVYDDDDDDEDDADD